MNKSQPVKVIVDKPRRKMKDDSLTARIINTAMHLKLFQGFLELSKNKIFLDNQRIFFGNTKIKYYCLREWLC